MINGDQQPCEGGRESLCTWPGGPCMQPLRLVYLPAPPRGLSACRRLNSVLQRRGPGGAGFLQVPVPDILLFEAQGRKPCLSAVTVSGHQRLSSSTTNGAEMVLSSLYVHLLLSWVFVTLKRKIAWLKVIPILHFVRCCQSSSRKRFYQLILSPLWR